MATLETVGRTGLGAERRFYTTMAMVVLASTILGFAPSYYLRFALPPPHPLEPLTPVVFLHGLVFSAWVLLFVAQVWFVAGRRLATHRKLGVIAVVLLAIMVPLAAIVGVGGVHRPLTAPPGIPPLQWAAIPLIDVPIFSGLIAAALVNRGRPQTHKRLMLCAMVDMMRPSLGRLLPALGLAGPIALVGPLLFLLPLMAWDLASARRIHPATIVGSLVVAGGTIGTLLVWSTPAWLAFAGRLAQL